MINGFLSPSNEPCISINLRDRQHSTKTTAIIDTGFNGYLAVPKKIITHHGWELIGSEKYEVATGHLETFDVYLGEMFWNKKWIPVYALVTNSKDILIGTKLLKNSILTIDFCAKKVQIEIMTVVHALRASAQRSGNHKLTNREIDAEIKKVRRALHRHKKI